MLHRGRNNLTDERFFFVTTTVVRFLHIFSSPPVCDILISNIKYYRTQFHFSVLGYVIMPSHFHWIVNVDPKYGTISDIMRDIKKHSAKEIIRYLSDDGILQKVFEQEAGGNIRATNLSGSNITSGTGIKTYKKLWIDRFDDKVIHDENMLLSTIRYIHNNPVVAGLVQKPEDYIYSSIHNYLSNDHSILDVDTEWTGIEPVV